MCIYICLVDLPQCFFICGLGFVVGLGFEVCTLSSFGQYFCVAFARWDGIVEVDFLNFRAAPPNAPALQQYFSHPRLIIYFLPAPSMELKIGDCKRWERLLTATHLDESNRVANQQQVLDCTVPLASLCKNAGPKPF